MLNMGSSIRYGEIKTPIRSHRQSVHVMTAKGNVYPESVMQSLPLFGNTVCIIVLQEPQVRDAGEPHLIAAGQDASCHPRDQ